MSFSWVVILKIHGTMERRNPFRICWSIPGTTTEQCQTSQTGWTEAPIATVGLVFRKTTTNGVFNEKKFRSNNDEPFQQESSGYPTHHIMKIMVGKENCLETPGTGGNLSTAQAGHMSTRIHRGGSLFCWGTSLQTVQASSFELQQAGDSCF